MKRKKTSLSILVLALCVTMILSMSACSGGGEDGSAANGSAPPASVPASDAGSGNAAGGNTDISGDLSILMMKTNEPGMTLVLEDFQTAYPDINVQAEFITDLTAFDTAVPTRFASGNTPDLVHLLAGKGGPTFMYPYGEAGKLTDLSDRAWVSGMYEPTKELFMCDGKVYCLDFGFCPLSCLLYDKDYFEANNLNVPTTFDELVEVVGQINAIGDRVPLSWGAADAPVNTNNVVVMAGNTVVSQDPDWLEKRVNDEVTFATDEGWKLALTQLEELISIGAFDPGVAAINMMESISNFAVGETAMLFAYGGMAGLVLSETPDMNIGETAFPGVTVEDTRVTLQAAGGMSIPLDAKNPDAANALLEFWSAPEELDKFADAASIISPNQARTGNLQGAYVDLKPMFESGKTISDMTALWPNTSFSTNAGSSIQGLFTGQKTVDQVLADLDTYFEE